MDIEECSICLDDMDNEYNSICSLECKHRFHTHCITLYTTSREFDSHCPLCRKKIEKIYVENSVKESCLSRLWLLISAITFFMTIIMFPIFTVYLYFFKV